MVLRLLLREGKQTQRRGPKIPSAVANAAGQFSPLTERKLEEYLLYRGRSGQFDEEEAIYIEPPPREKCASAAIWCRWDFDLPLPSCAFYLGLWSARPGAHSGATRPVFLGFRYETPEDGDNHNYYHAQPCRSMGARDSKIRNAVPVSERNPTFPMAAESSLELLLCLVTSIHGMRGLTTLKSSLSEQATMRRNCTLWRSLDRILGLQGTPQAQH